MKMPKIMKDANFMLVIDYEIQRMNIKLKVLI